jgi:hypothetical protein
MTDAAVPKQQHAEPKSLSNAEKAAKNLADVVAYLGSLDVVPFRIEKGERVANISQIMLGAKVDRQVYNTRQDVKDAVAAAVREKGLGVPNQTHAAPGSDALPPRVAQRIKALEEQLAVAKAEARALREKAARYAHMERHLTDTGMLAR